MERFLPAIGLQNRHLQTLYSTLFRSKIKLNFTTEIFELDDGDFVECCWIDKPKNDDGKPIVILFHGLEGSSDSPYIQGAMNALSNAGFSSVLMHFRGCGKKQNRLPRLYHSGDTADAKALITHISTIFSKSKLYAIGYSMGGNMLLKLLGEWEDNSLLSGAISVSAPMQLDISAKTINTGGSKFYQYYLLRHLKKSLLEKYERYPMEAIIGLKKSKVSDIGSIWLFDHLYTAKMHNFGSAKEYYKQASAKQYLKYIKTPTLIIHAIDDPFMDKSILPTKKEISDHITLEVYPYGGHVGFISGTIFKPKYWLDQRVVDWFGSL